MPGQELIKRGYDVALTDQLNEQEVLAADVAVFLRHHSREALRLMKAAKKAGTYVVYDIDDMLWSLDPENPHFPYWSRPDVVEGLEACIRAADLVTTTTETLAKMLRGRNAHVKVLPNMLPREVWPYEGAKPQTDEHVVIGWAGGTSHWQDLEVLGDSVYNVLERYENAWFVFCGMERVPFELRDRLVVIPGVPITEFSEVLRTFDIGLAPLNDTKFNRCKSDLRALEYSAVGIPVVATDIDSFAGFVRDEESGLLVKSPAEWERTLGRLIEDRELRERMGGRAYEEAEQRFIGRTVWLWEEAYGVTPPQTPAAGAWATFGGRAKGPAASAAADTRDSGRDDEPETAEPTHRRSSGPLVMTLLVRDEEDIVRQNLEYHYSVGVDYVIATDNGSTDGTRKILEEYERQGRLRIIDEPVHNHAQDRWVNRMGEAAYSEFGACAVFHCDADEFWMPRNGDLKRTILDAPVDVLYLQVRNVLLPDLQGRESIDAAAFVVTSPRFVDHPESEFKDHNLYLFTYPPKVIFKTIHRPLTVINGNHAVREPGVSAAASDEIAVLHYPVRGRAHFIQKITNGGQALERNKQITEDTGYQWRWWYQRLREGAIDDEYRRLLVADEVAAELERQGVIESLARFIGRFDVPADLLPGRTAISANPIASAPAQNDAEDEGSGWVDSAAPEEVWRRALVVRNDQELVESTLEELGSYFGITPRQARELAETSIDETRRAWLASERDSAEQMVEFYDQTAAYIFELMWWHSLAFDTKPLLGVDLLRTALREPGRSYLDVGAGVGSMGLLFARHGFTVSLADVSGVMQQFARWRFEARSLSAQFIDMKEERLPREVFDFVSMIDVIEHVPDPVDVTRSVLDAVRPGGLLAMNNVGLGSDSVRPMHLVHDPEQVIEAIRAYPAEVIRRDASDDGMVIVRKPSVSGHAQAD